jgi:two-component system, LytTR family, response regulator
VRVLIVDDERLARERMRGMLAQQPSVTSIAEAANVTSAADAIRANCPDVVFLDIEMPGGNGFELLERASGDFAIVFVTAFDEYAVRAFEVNALDYLVKPVDPARLSRTLERIASRAPVPRRDLRPLSADDRLFLPRERSGRFVSLTSVVAITAAGSYSEVRTSDGRTDLVHRTMEEWEAVLPGAIFRRVHRSAIVNLDLVVRTERLLTGGYLLRMQSGPPVTVSRRQGVLLRRSATGA